MSSSDNTESNMALAKTIISTVGSIAATAMVVRSVIRDFLPSEFEDSISIGMKRIFNKYLTNQVTMVIDEFDGLDVNQAYEAAQIYLGTKLSPDTNRFKVSKPLKEKNFNVSMERNEEVTDVFNGHEFTWVWACVVAGGPYARRNSRDMNSLLRSEVKSFELTFHRENRDFVLETYLPYIINEAKLQQHAKRTLKIHTLDYDSMYDLSEVWMPVNLDDPATFETLAMDPELKGKIVKDLDRFVKRKEYYRKVGKAWKRGYLLDGPPGTGKSSLIAPMANYLHFNIYDLELTELKKNSELRRVLLATANGGGGY